MEEKIKSLLIDKPLIIPKLIFNNYKKLNITDSELILLIFIINEGENIEYNPGAFEKELNIDKYKILELIDSMQKKNIVSLVVNKQDRKASEYISLKPLYDKIISIIIDNKEETKEVDTNLFTIFEKELGRTLSPLEYEKINEWGSNISEELIIEALKEAVFCGVNNFRYIETILYDWKKKGYKTKNDIIKDKENRKNRNKKDVNIPDIDWLNDE